MAAQITPAGMNGHIMSDRANWQNFGNMTGLAVLFEGEAVMLSSLPTHSLPRVCRSNQSEIALV